MENTNTTNLKKNFYIFSFTVLGLLIGLVVYGLGGVILLNYNIEINLQAYLSILIFSGTIAGYFEGRRWWRIIYVEKAYLKWSKSKLETKLLGLLVLIVLSIAVLLLMIWKY